MDVLAKLIAADRALENRSESQSFDVFLPTNQPEKNNICLTNQFDSFESHRWELYCQIEQK